MFRMFFTILFSWCCINLFAQDAKHLKQLSDKYSSGMFRGGDAHVLVPMAEPAAFSAFNVFQYLQGRVPGLQIYAPGISFTPSVYYRSGQPAFFLDEMRVDAQMLASISMNDIAIVKVFRPPFMGGFSGGNGAIAVYTKDGDEQ